MILNSFLLIGVEVVEACPVALLEEFKVVELLELEFVVDPPSKTKATNLFIGIFEEILIPY